jgi:hypothetical protein
MTTDFRKSKKQKDYFSIKSIGVASISMVKHLILPATFLQEPPIPREDKRFVLRWIMMVNYFGAGIQDDIGHDLVPSKF